MERLKLFGVGLLECLPHWGLGNEVLRFSVDNSICSLWNACLFPMCPDQQTSFSRSSELAQVIQGGSILTLSKDLKLISMLEPRGDAQVQEGTV